MTTTAAGKKRILVVEDEAVTAMDLKSNLIQLGYEVTDIVSSGKDAVRAAGESHPDLVLMDITLNGPMNGIEAAREIRESLDIPVIFLTAHADTETLGRAKTAEPLGYLSKPSGINTLMSTLEIALYKSEADAKRKIAEAGLKRVTDQQKIILDNIGVGVLFSVYRKILWSSRGFSGIFGYTPEQVGGRDAELLYPDRKSYVKIGAEGDAAFGRGEIYTGEVQLKKRDETLIWCHMVGQAVKPGDPDEGVIWLIEDVTKRREMEEALRKNEEKFRTVADFTYDWEFWIGSDETIIYMSPSCERITGYAPAAFDQDSTLLRKLLHPDDVAAYDQHRHEATAQKKSSEMEFRIIRPDGAIRWIAHTCQPVYDGQGKFTGTRGSNRDITTRKASEQERERLISELKDALANVKALSGMLPICAACKKIRDDKGYWSQVEIYISAHSEAEFSHGICPDCAKRIYGKYYQEEK